MISIIGPGKMGQAMADQLQDLYEVQLCGRGEEPQGEVVIFAVKPQDFAACIEDLSTDLSDRLIISIMVGVSLENLQKATGSKRVVRSMPNLPLTVGEGLTGWVANTDHDKAREIFSCFGDEVELQDESQMDAFTALAGSGPGYFFWLAELLGENAKALGFSEEKAAVIARQVFIGAAKTLEEDEQSAGEWRKAVTSKGGTTEAAIAKMSSEKLPEIFANGIEAATERSKELNS